MFCIAGLVLAAAVSAKAQPHVVNAAFLVTFEL